MSSIAFPHVTELLIHDAKQLHADGIERILGVGVETGAEARIVSKWVWAMADRMAVDGPSNIPVMERVDISDMLPDVGYKGACIRASSVTAMSGKGHVPNRRVRADVGRIAEGDTMTEGLRVIVHGAFCHADCRGGNEEAQE
ncbi:MAG: hypothetical protein WCC36_01025 [Gammaproteobacteria bacterium]